MKLSKVAGATSEIWEIFIANSASTSGAGLTGLVFNSASLTAYYHRNVGTTATAITLATMTVGTFTSSGFKEIDATNMPGWYQFCPPDAAIAAGAKSCSFHLQGAANMAPLPIEVQLTAVNPDSATAFVTSVLLSSGTGTGQLDFTSGVVKASLVQILGTALTETAGQIAAAFVKFFNKATPTGTINSIPDAVAGAASGLAIVGSAVSLGSGAIAASTFAAGAIDSTVLATNAAQEIADAYLDRADAVEVGLTPRQLQRLEAAALAGKASGLETTTAVYRNAVADSKPRITATVDEYGNRTAVTTDVT